MRQQDTSRVGKRGVVVIPVRLRRRFGLEEGSLVVVEEVPEGVLVRPAVAIPVEVYSPARRAEFLLNNAVSEEDYRAALDEVRRLGIDPTDIPHVKPEGAQADGRP
ncbi:MAG: AbrB/MazE/SpoVT family DNA-binding domain-containing protein [Polyangia bacterium]|jgi:AbrB family looped-hinge helix DNA binding protein|nr:AbrB/MazE/SpoVT family DNA-binding domain-containing protein [Polyangia bacterium]